MIKIENIEVWGLQHAIRGMRNPMNSWERSDSTFLPVHSPPAEYVPEIGENDLDLMRKLYKGGSTHRKYLRQIMVSLDITAPLYWWKEFDTYKVGTVANSCSTMHKIQAKEFVIDDFSTEHLSADEHALEDTEVSLPFDAYSVSPLDVMLEVIAVLNVFREKYVKTKDKECWWQMIQLLPSSYNQRRTVTLSYENVMSMIDQREHHKLDEWRELVEIFKSLPYVEKIRAGSEKRGD